MKRIFCSLMIMLLSMGALVCSAENQAEDFRDLRWGMTQAEVEGAEGIPVYKDEANMEYLTSVLGFDCQVLYFFRDDKLIGAGCAFLHDHADETEFVRDYDKLKEELSGKYGKPVRTEAKWKNGRYRNRPEQWGRAVVSGELELTTVWETERTMIGLDLKGEDDERRFALVYYSREDYKTGGLEKETEDREEELNEGKMGE